MILFGQPDLTVTQQTSWLWLCSMPLGHQQQLRGHLEKREIFSQWAGQPGGVQQSCWKKLKRDVHCIIILLCLKESMNNMRTRWLTVFLLTPEQLEHKVRPEGCESKKGLFFWLKYKAKFNCPNFCRQMHLNYFFQRFLVGGKAAETFNSNSHNYYVPD